ncbi:DEAD/DEAH box helicase [Ectothiorhodospira shaposhnikovii]|uniref:DEAD/DEAH box helicase n=1 Tax=Ectothiorhodospira shaposhnikovii TaxID=1054 RepID=UPI001EE7A40E|nr:DEAD/DEAH box helicase [Ectothiorhodospira shaposhnikovii]MCG5512839.1 DEAD/DEAH box helicase [Ectothiorhodospira shaposhnikovii]
MSQVLQIAHNAVTAKLVNPSREIKLEVSTLLSYRVNGAEHSGAFKSGNWDGRSTFFDFRQGTFPAGFVGYVQEKLSGRGYVVQIVRKPLPEPLGPENPVIDTFGDDPKYDYQMETVRRLERHGRIIAQVATGGGKSRICRLAYARIKRPALFLTTRSVLMYQMKDAFEEAFKIKAGVMGDSEWSPRKGFNVAMVQTLIARLLPFDPKAELERMKGENLKAQAKALKEGVAYKEMPVEAMKRQIQAKMKAHEDRRALVKRILAYFEFVILEEAHEASASGYYDILNACKNAHYRLALTATPFMRQDEEANMRLMAVAGQVGIRISEKMLIDRGILAKPFFKYVDLPKPDKLYRTTPWQRAYRIGIVENKERNLAIVKECLRASKLNMPSMVLVQHQRHGEILQDMMERAGIRAQFIYGKHEQEQRRAALGALGDGSLQVLIGSTILDVGVDVPAVGLVVLAGGGKAEVALRQRIGRGLRRKKCGPNVALVVDFSDSHNAHLKEHGATRRAIVEATEGFVENILPPGADFDLAGMGLLGRKAA